MWLGVFAAWIVGSIVLYAYLVVTAREPRHAECMDCRSICCDGCALVTGNAQTEQMKKAA